MQPLAANTLAGMLSMYVGPQISGRRCGGVNSEDRLSLSGSLCSHSRY